MANGVHSCQFLKFRIIGVERVIKRLQKVNAGIRNIRVSGVTQVGIKLLEAKKKDCINGLYVGVETGKKNVYRYGWEWLGEPQLYELTHSILKAHKRGKRYTTGTSDFIDVYIDLTVAPHAKFVHGDHNIETGMFFFNKMLNEYVQQRPWLKADKYDLREAKIVLIASYKKKI